MDVPSLDARTISFQYDEATVLDELSLRTDPGEFVGIIGPNGSGKSTLLRLLAGVIRPSSGDVFLGDRNMAGMSRREVARIVAVVPQETSVSFGFTGLELVLMGRSPHVGRFSLESAEDVGIARRVMDATDTWQFRDRRVDAVSGGEKQRLVIARALAQEPSILLLDEPTSALDIRHQVNIYALLQRFHAREGLSVILVSHDLNLAARACTRLVLLKEGRIVRDGTPREVLKADTLSETYGTELRVREDPDTGSPMVVTPLTVVDG